jgi:hypothetical protein
MRYIKHRDDFLKKYKSDIILEVLENDITWGGSLLGRLINSTIRRGKIMYKTTKIGDYVKQLQTELDILISESQLSNSDEFNKNSTLIKVRFLITEIYKVVISSDSPGKKKGQLIGDETDESGLIQITIKEIEKLKKEQFTSKQNLIDKLVRFRESLIRLNIEPEETSDDVDSNSDHDFYIKTIDLLKSVVGLDDIISNNKVKISEPLNKGMTQSTIKKNTHTTNTEKIDAKSVSNDKNDVPESTLESIFYNNESLPIFEDVEINKNENQAISIWGKITNSWNKSGVSKCVPRIKDIVKKSESGDEVSKKWIMNIGRQVIINKTTIGKVIKLDDILKESESIKNTYNDIPKSISLISRYILSLKEDMRLIGSLGKSSVYIKSFINSFKDMDLIFPKMSKVDKKINESEGPLSSPPMTTEDPIKKEWSKEFKDGEEKEWVVSEKELSQLQRETESLKDKPSEIDANKYYDHIIRIINIFGEAYKSYATDVIPSGRPNGRVSQKTFREYEYIGDGSSPNWSSGEGPSGGPWAAKAPYQKWQDGVMGILENPNYRKVLANVKFVSKPEEKTDTKTKRPGSGRTLFTFINDLLSGDGNFRKVRKKTLNDYFTTEEMKIIDKETKTDSSISTVTIKEDDRGDIKQLSFESNKTLGFNPQMDSFKDGKNTIIKSFIYNEYKTSNGNVKMISYLTNHIKTDSKKNYLLFKFQTGGIQSIISSYLSKTIKKEGLILPKDIENKDNSKIFIGVIDLSDGYLANGQSFKIKYIDASIIKNASESDFKSMTISNITVTKLLTKLVNIKNNEQKREIVKIKETESYNTKTDIVNVNKMISTDEKLKNGFGISGKII